VIIGPPLGELGTSASHFFGSINQVATTAGALKLEKPHSVF